MPRLVSNPNVVFPCCAVLVQASWPDTGAFNAALNAAVNCRQLTVAEALLEVRMPQLGVVPDFRSFNILLKGYAAAGEAAKLRALYARMQVCLLHPCPRPHASGGSQKSARGGFCF